LRVIPIDQYDKEGNLTKIIFQGEDGEDKLDAIWDENDEQTSENRIHFRKWAYTMAKRTGFEVDE